MASPRAEPHSPRVCRRSSPWARASARSLNAPQRLSTEGGAAMCCVRPRRGYIKGARGANPRACYSSTRRATRGRDRPMAEHKATISWTRKGSPEDFTKGKYSREHTWTFDGGVTVPRSSPASAVDPEEALVAAISSCHMLTFVYLAQKAGFVVDSYQDAAVGKMTKAERG